MHRGARGFERAREPVLRFLADDGLQAVVTSGGTGISARDTTYEALAVLLDKPLFGFGELFRSLSFREIGSAAILSRATAGLLAGKVVLALPGSPKALRLAVEQILLPEAGHLVQQTRG